MQFLRKSECDIEAVVLKEQKQNGKKQHTKIPIIFICRKKNPVYYKGKKRKLKAIVILKNLDFIFGLFFWLCLCLILLMIFRGILQNYLNN